MTIPDNIFSIPDILPDKIDLPNRKLHCCSMNPDSYLQSPFLDNRIVTSDEKKFLFDVNELIVRSKNDNIMTTHFVFHNAFCCSTLFSRFLNAYRSALVLREPNVLLEQASIYRFSGTSLLPNIDNKFVDSLFEMITTLLSRRYSENDAVIIKPTDACNNLMGKLLDRNPDNQCLLMYSDIERFLTAIFKVPQRGEWIKIRANELCLDEMKKNGKLRANPQSLTHFQLAALVWVLHMEKFRNLINRYGNDRVQVLNSEDFMRDQTGSVSKFLKFIKLNVDEKQLTNNINNVMQVHSKAGQKYSSAQRETDYQLQRLKHANDVKAGVSWAKSMFGEDFIYRLDESIP